MARKAVMIFINCWKCGQKFQINQDHYTNGAICEDC